MARRLPPRDSRGRFLKRGRKAATKRRRRTTTARRNPPRRRLSARDSSGRFVGSGGGRRTKRRSRARSNPPGWDIMGRLQEGVIGGTGVVAGKIIARTIPTFLNMPASGNMGLALQGAAGVLGGILVSELVPGSWGDYVLAGGVAAPMETWLASAGIPGVSAALRGNGMGAYLQPVPPTLPGRRGVSSYPRRPGMGSYARAGGGAVSTGYY